MSDLKKPTPDWLVERLAQGELPPVKVREIEQRLAAEGQGAGPTLAALEQSNNQILARLPAEMVVPAIVRRAEQAAAARRGARRTRVLWLAPALAVGVLAVFAPSSMRAPHQAAGSSAVVEADDVRIKGGVRLLAYRQSAGGGEPLADGSAVRPRDVVQLAVIAAGRRNGVVVSIDGRGGVTLHLPASPGAPTALPSGDGNKDRTVLPNSFQLDDAPEFERFFFVTADEPVSVDKVLDAARSLARRPADARIGTLALPPRLEQSSLLLRKVQP